MALQLPDYNLNEEQREFRDTLRRYFAERAPIAETRSAMGAGGGYSEAIWSEASGDLGLAGIAISEAHGGQGFGLRELAIALAEVGRGLVPIPLFSSAVLAGGLVEAVCDDAQMGQWLGPIAAGDVATAAWVEDSTSWNIGDVALSTEKAEASGRVLLTGEKHFVSDAPHAKRIFVIAREQGTSGLDGLGLFAVERDAVGLEVTQRETLDPTRPVSSLRFEGVRARRVGRSDVGAELSLALDRATALLCSEMVGSMDTLLHTAVDYAAERHQFSRPIGSFQAIKHKCADLLIDFEASRTAMDGAIVAFCEDDPERALLACVAKAHVGPAFLRMATESMQIQGGVGYTWEYDAHLYYRRALGAGEWLGSAQVQHRRIALEIASGSTGEAAA